MVLMVDFGDEMLQWGSTPIVYIRGPSLDLPKDDDIKVARIQPKFSRLDSVWLPDYCVLLWPPQYETPHMQKFKFTHSKYSCQNPTLVDYVTVAFIILRSWYAHIMRLCYVWA